jgi:RP/EB family microtubule-associated protein
MSTSTTSRSLQVNTAKFYHVGDPPADGKLVYFAQKGIDRPIHIEKLVKCKMQDNLEFLQWTKKFWDQNFPGGDYDAAGRRKGAPAEIGGNPKPPIRANVGNTAALQQENQALKESVVGLEKERDFYFSKLRDIELLVQQAVEEQPELEQDQEGLIPNIQAILYSTEVCVSHLDVNEM